MIKSLLDWFKGDFMSWTPINPVCKNCSSAADGRVPMRVEIIGGPRRKCECGPVEIHSCDICGHKNLVPKYGEIPKVAAARTGRSTEWSTLFGAS